MAADAETRAKRLEREIFLRSLTFGRPLGSAATQLADHIEEVFFLAGSTIYRAHDAAEDLFFVLRGDVSLEADGMEPWLLKDRSIVGVLDVLLERPRARTATAVTDVHAFRLEADDYFDMLEDNFEYLRGAVLTIAADLHALSLGLAPTGGFAAPTGAHPPHAERALNLVERITLLRESPAFKGGSIQALTSMAGFAEEVRVADGELLFRRGGAGGKFFLVASGLFEIEREAPTLRARFGPMQLVCGYGALGAAEEQYTARSVGHSVALSVREEDFFDLMELHFDLARSVMAAMAHERERLLRERAVAGAPGPDVPLQRVTG